MATCPDPPAAPGTPRPDPSTGNPTPGNPTPGNPTPGNPTPGNPTPGNPTPGNPKPGTVLDAALIRGIACYRRHPWTRMAADPPAIWADGPARILDYAADHAAGHCPAQPAILFVPSLINRAYILDLMPDSSMMRWLAKQGLRPLLLDWGWPGTLERTFTLTDIIAGTLERALAAAARHAQGPVVLAGYCMGGLLALAAALRRPDLVQALALLATPWDFHAGGPGSPQPAAALAAIEPLMALTGTLPVDALQFLLASGGLAGIAGKFRAFGTIDQTSAAAARFVALEDWVNDGVPLAAPVAREALAGWYGANSPMRGSWRVAGETVVPQRLNKPCFVAIPQRDRIVPPLGALPLAAMIGGAVVHRPAAGHIGMTAGTRAETDLWRPLLDWVRSL